METWTSLFLFIMETDRFYEFLNHAVDLFVENGYQVTISSNTEGEVYVNAYYIPETSHEYPDFLSGFDMSGDTEINPEFE